MKTRDHLGLAHGSDLNFHTAPYHGQIPYRNELSELRHPTDRRRSSVLSEHGEHGLCLEDLTNNSLYLQAKKSEMEAKCIHEYGINGDCSDIVDQITQGCDKFSDVLLHNSRSSDENSSGDGTALSKTSTNNNSRKQSFSNMSSLSLPSHRKSASNVLQFPQLRREITASSSQDSQFPSQHQSQEATGNSLVKQFLQSASHAKKGREIIPNVAFTSQCVTSASGSVGLDSFDLSLTEKILPLLNKSNLPMELESDLKTMPDYCSLDYTKHIKRDLAWIELRIKYYLVKNLLPQEMELSQNSSTLDKYMKDIDGLATEIKNMQEDITENYRKELELHFKGTNESSFTRKLTDLTKEHLQELTSLEAKVSKCQSILEARKLQLRKLENLVKVNDMIDDFKRNMKFSQKIKEYYGTFGDIIVLTLLISALAYFFRRWFF